MTYSAIVLEGVGKRYQLGVETSRYRTLREALMESASRMVRRGPSPAAAGEFWALRDVTLEIPAGQVVGIVGSNGAGKSTLLKVLSRITAPTVGRARVRGRVGSLLEVGTGFHPELTGRENIFLNGAILGMRRAEILANFDAIVEFAEVSEFIDTPVKRYSSGMYLRLAFAVAAHLEPEILFVDEVLAVGDAAFQKKCLGKMSDVARHGRTVLFVSHSTSAVLSLCDRAVWLRRGEVEEDGPPRTVIGSYLRSSNEPGSAAEWETPATAPGNGPFRLRAARARPLQESTAGELTTSTTFAIEFDYWNMVADARFALSINLYNQEGALVFSMGPPLESVYGGQPLPVGLLRDVVRVPGDLLNDGVHRVELRVFGQAETIYQRSDALVFTLHDSPKLRGSWFGPWAGAIRPALDWRTELLEASDPRR